MSAPSTRAPRASVPCMGEVTCPDCGGGLDMHLEATGPAVYIVHRSEGGCGHRAYAGPVSGLPAASPLALELAFAAS